MRKELLVLTLILSVLLCPGVNAQNPSIATPLVPYTSCSFPDGLQIVGLDPLAPGITFRTVATADGPQRIDMKAGERIMFGYPLTDFFANVKVEALPAESYPALKKALLANLQYLLVSSAGEKENDSLPLDLHGFEVHGQDRQKLEGGVLGMYLLFDDANHVVTTAYLLNQQPWQRKFQSLEEYAGLRDRFLQTYTGCVRQNQAIAK